MRFRWLLMLSFVLCVGVLGGTRPDAHTNEPPSAAIGAITGTVTDTTGAPLANVRVYVFTTFGPHLLDQLVGQVQTDAWGHYTANNVVNGSFAVYTKNTLGYVDELYNDVTCVYDAVIRISAIRLSEYRWSWRMAA